jgi:hypothetical protein
LMMKKNFSKGMFINFPVKQAVSILLFKQ